MDEIKTLDAINIVIKMSLVITMDVEVSANFMTQMLSSVLYVIVARGARDKNADKNNGTKERVILKYREQANYLVARSVPLIECLFA